MSTQAAAVEHQEDEARTLWQESYQGEVLGEAYFARMRELAADAQEQEKIDHLVRLERSTKEMLVPCMDRLGLPTGSDQSVLASVAALDDYEWRSMLEGVRPVAAGYLVKYRRLAELVDAVDRPVADALVAHELALDEFCRLELEGRPEQSLERIRALPHFR